MNVTPIPKCKRVVDKKGMAKVKAIESCENCGSKNCLEVAHIVSKGARGPDIKENAVKLCGPAAFGAGCHGANHKGNITKEQLFAIVAKREGQTIEEVKEIVHKAWRFGIYEPCESK